MSVTETRPESGRSSPASSRSIVLFPEPERPLTTVRAPAGTSRSTSSRTGRPARATDTCEARATTRPEATTGTCGPRSSRRRLGRAVRCADQPDRAVVVHGRHHAGQGPGGAAQHLGQPDPAAVVDHQRLLRIPRIPLFADPAVPDAHHPVGHSGGAVVVADEQQSCAGRGCGLGQQVVHAVGGCPVESAGGLVSKQQRRPVGDRGRDTDALCLSAGEGVRPPRGEAGEVELVQHLCRPARGPARRRSPPSRSCSATLSSTEISGRSTRAAFCSM